MIKSRIFSAPLVCLFCVFFVLTFSVHLQAQLIAESTCLGEMQAIVQKESRTLEAQYSLDDPQSGKVREFNESRVHIGQNGRAAIILHGYAASPFEVNAISEVFQELGYTTLQPLIHGFGSSVGLANSSNSKQWKESVVAAIQAVGHCVKSLSLVGFSLGGTLISDLVLNDPNMSPEGIYKLPNGGSVQIEKIVLASPFFQLGIHIPPFIVEILQTLIPSLDAKSMYRNTKIADLEAISRFPQFYNSIMPLTTARNVLKYGDDILDHTKGVSKIPVLLAYSDSDITISKEQASKFVSDHFEKSETFVIAKEFKVPHQFLILDLNPQLPIFFEKMKTFLTALTPGAFESFDVDAD